MSLLELLARGADGHCPPSHDVARDFRHAGLDTQRDSFVVPCAMFVTTTMRMTQQKMNKKAKICNTKLGFECCKAGALL